MHQFSPLPATSPPENRTIPSHLSDPPCVRMTHNTIRIRRRHVYLTLRALAPEDDAEAVGILQQRGDYFRALIGRMPQAEHLALLRSALPEGAHPDQKRLVGIEADGRIAGVLDV